MALHTSTHNLIEEAITEYLAIADYCLMTAKPTGGCYGYPTALLLFTIVDTIGSFHRKDDSLTINIDGKSKKIIKDGYEHYFILNSHYYGQSLREIDIKKLYEYYRCLLVHNAALPPMHFLIIGKPTDTPFAKRIQSQHIDIVNLKPFVDVSHNAVKIFLVKAPTLIPASKQGQGINRK